MKKLRGRWAQFKEWAPSEERPWVLVIASLIGLGFFVLIWALVFRLRCLGDGDRALIAFILAGGASLVAAFDILLSEKPSGWAIVSAYFSLGAAALVGPIEGGPLKNGLSRGLTLGITVAGLFILSVIFLAKYFGPRTPGNAVKNPKAPNDHNRPADEKQGQN